MFIFVYEIQFNRSSIQVTVSLKVTLHCSLVNSFLKVKWFVPFPPIESESVPHLSLKCSIMGFGLEVIYEVQTFNLYFEEKTEC